MKPMKFALPEFDQFKLKIWQKQALHAWINEGERGIVSAVPGSGKTHLALALMLMHPEASFLVVVPSQELAKQWILRIKETTTRFPCYMDESHDFGFEKTTVEIVNTIIKREDSFKLETTPDYIILDEVHRYLGYKFRKVLSLPTSKPYYNESNEFMGYRGIIGLTATIPDEKLHPLDHKLLIKIVGSVIFKYGFDEALRDKNIVPYRITIYKVGLTPVEDQHLQEIQDKINMNKQILRKKLKEKGIELNIGVLLRRRLPPEYNMPETNMLRKLYLDRRHLAFKARNKIYNAVLLAKMLLVDKTSHTIIFTMTIEVAEEIAEQLQPEAEVIHSKRKKDDNNAALDRFREKFTRLLVVVRTVDEGVDLPSLTNAIIVANSKQIRQMIQRVGRILRVHLNVKKEAHVSIFEVPGDEFDIDELKESATDVEYQDLNFKSLADEKYE